MTADLLAGLDPSRAVGSTWAWVLPWAGPELCLRSEAWHFIHPVVGASWLNIGRGRPLCGDKVGTLKSWGPCLFWR